MSQEVSRRTFIRTATGLIAVNWGGLPFWRDPHLHSLKQQDGQRSIPMPEEFIYGAEFFGPPNPPRALRHEMLKAIANEYKFNIIRIYCSWVYLNPGQESLTSRKLKKS